MKKNLAHLTLAAAILTNVGTASAAIKQWNVVSGTWSNPANWLLASPPISTDIAHIGSTVAAENGWVNLNVPVTLAGLEITDGMMVDSNGHAVVINGATTISGYNHFDGIGYPSRLRIDQGAALVDGELQSLTLSNEGWLEIEDGATVEINGYANVTSGSAIHGTGILNLRSNGAVALTLNGGLGASVDVAPLVVNQLGTGRIDLDGNVANDHTLNITGARVDGTAFAALTINGDELLDAMDDDIWVGGGNTLTMNFTNGWELGSFATLKLFNSEFGPAQVNGSTLTFGGSLEMPGTGSAGRFNASVIVEPWSSMELGPSDLLEFWNGARLDGGFFTLAPESRMDIYDFALISGGTFITSDGGLHARVRLFGTTAWFGDVSSTVAIAQEGDASVVGPTIIDSNTFDMDGLSFSDWSIESSLVVNADTYDDSGFPAFGGNMTVNGGLLSKLTMNLSDPAMPFIIGDLAGTLNLEGVGNLLITRYAGSPLVIQKALNITGNVRVDAPLTIQPNATLSLPASTDILNVTSLTHISANSNENGVGTITNAATGDLVLDDGASMSGVGVINHGIFRIDDSAGSAMINRFTNSSTGNWIAQVGGHTPATEHDRLVIGGPTPTSLDGTLSVDLIDLGGGTFIPIIGDTFTILESRSGVVGTFTNSPISVVNGTAVEWTVLYTPTAVSIRADQITQRCPADFNQDGIVDFFDYLDFVDAFSAESAAADFNHDGIIDFFDYLDFVDAFSAGC